MKQYAGWFCFVLLLGTVLGFTAGKWEAHAQGSGVDNKTTRWLAGTITYGQAADAFVLFDSQTNRLIAYTITGSKQLQLIATREISWDIKPITYGKQEPTVHDMKLDFERSEKEREEKEKKEKEKGK